MIDVTFFLKHNMLPPNLVQFNGNVSRKTLEIAIVKVLMSPAGGGA